jgi:beta-lactamase regulating signal transducer with metallopeptidase domain
MRGAAPEHRHGLACAALFVLALLPLGTFVLVWIDVSSATASAAAPGVIGALRHDDSPAGLLPRAMPWLLAGWGIGVGLLATRSIVGWARLGRLVRRATALDTTWQRRFESLKQRVDVGGRVRILATASLAAPIVAGCWRPAVLLPLSVFTGLSASHLEALILHELVHIKRGDLWIHRLQLILETLFFYHPATWWISRALHAEREFRCDATVVALTGDRLGYARALTGLESLRGALPYPALASTGGFLMSRIRSIVNPTPSSTRSPLFTTVCSLGAIGLVVALVATTGAIGEATHSHTPAWMPESVSRWSAEFETAAKRHGVDPALLSIVTLVESRGNPDAVSSWGARGLMQIMPATAEKIAAARGIGDFDVQTLADPATNIDFGAWYLAEQVAAFGDGSLSEETVGRAAAAYNGGPKRLRQHLDDGRPLSEESEKYSRLVSDLWNDRERSDSEALARWMTRRGS